jgi:hypothetical protein
MWNYYLTTVPGDIKAQLISTHSMDSEQECSHQALELLWHYIL